MEPTPLENAISVLRTAQANNDGITLKDLEILGITKERGEKVLANLVRRNLLAAGQFDGTHSHYLRTPLTSKILECVNFLEGEFRTALGISET